MNTTKKLICMLAAGATLVVSAPVFADWGHDRGHDYYRDHRPYTNYDRHDYRGYRRDFDRRHVFVVRRPVIVEPAPYYVEPAPYYVQPAPPVAYGIGPAAIIGATIGAIIDSGR